MGELIAAYGSYTNALMEAGVLVAGERLRESTTATTASICGGKTSLLDGPYAETKEQLGGFYIIDVPDLDTAISWTARHQSTLRSTLQAGALW